MSGRRPIPRRRRQLPVARRDPGRAWAAHTDPRPRRAHPADGAAAAERTAAPEEQAVAPGFRPAAGRLRGLAASAGPPGAKGSAPTHRRSRAGTDRELPGPAGRSGGQGDRTPGQRSRGRRRDRPGYTRRVRTDPLAHTGLPDRSPPPIRMDRTRCKGRPGHTPGARTGRPSLTAHPAGWPAQAGPTGPRPARSGHWPGPAAWGYWASLPRRTTQPKKTIPIPVGRAGFVAPVTLGNPVILGNPMIPGNPVTLGNPMILGDPVTSGDPVTHGNPVILGNPANPRRPAYLRHPADPADPAGRADPRHRAR